MYKSGKDAIIITAISGILGSLAIVLKDANTGIAIGVFIACLVFIYILISRGLRSAKVMVDKASRHPVFNLLDYCLTTELETLPIDNRIKKEFVMKYLRTKLLITQEIVERTLGSDDISFLPKEIMDIFSNTKSRLGNSVPAIFMEKLYEWDVKNNSWVSDTVIGIMESSYYASCESKKSAILDCIKAMVRITFINVENTVNSLNGELDIYLSKLNEGKNERK